MASGQNDVLGILVVLLVVVIVVVIVVVVVVVVVVVATCGGSCCGCSFGLWPVVTAQLTRSVIGKNCHVC